MAPASSGGRQPAQGTLVHKDMWDNLLTDDSFDPQQEPDRGKRNRAAASISSVCSDDVPFRTSFSGMTTEELAGAIHSLDLEQMSVGLGATGHDRRTHDHPAKSGEDTQRLVGLAHGEAAGTLDVRCSTVAEEASQDSTITVADRVTGAEDEAAARNKRH